MCYALSVNENTTIRRSSVYGIVVRFNENKLFLIEKSTQYLCMRACERNQTSAHGRIMEV